MINNNHHQPSNSYPTSVRCRRRRSRSPTCPWWRRLFRSTGTSQWLDFAGGNQWFRPKMKYGDRMEYNWYNGNRMDIEWNKISIAFSHGDRMEYSHNKWYNCSKPQKDRTAFPGWYTSVYVDDIFLHNFQVSSFLWFLGGCYNRHVLLEGSFHIVT